MSNSTMSFRTFVRCMGIATITAVVSIGVFVTIEKLTDRT